MPLSISSSEPGALQERRHAPPPGLRLTASDRPGVAQPVPERDIPDRPWGAISLAVLVLTLALTGLWEWRMRALELSPGVLADGPSAWAEQRRRVRTEPVAVAIVGDSRILFDTDLDRFEKMTGVRPLQLALAGTNARPFLEDLAADPKFKGLAIVGLSDWSYFRKGVGLSAAALDRGRWESPAQRGSYLVQRQLTPHLAMLDKEYSLSTLVARLDPGLRPGVRGPYGDVWKLSDTAPGRQTWLWPRIEHDARLRGHARAVWINQKRTPAPQAVIDMTLASTKASVAKIRARGGDVVFVRPPSAPEFRVKEDQVITRAKGWDALLAAAQAKGAHFEDMPAAQGLDIPEFSHLSRACATVFTDAYVRRLAELTPRLRLQGDMPPLSRADCVAAARPGA
ncbi:MAG: hypothetical protein JWQ29_1881 [Phenylobacterium sp.]|nr:hypothetical protein [Phenylobacterium sp.]